MSDSDSPQPTSVRFQHDELELLDAWCAYYSEGRGFKHSRSDLIRNLLKKVPPPDETVGESPLAHRVRTAYTTVFRKAPPESGTS